MDLDIVLKLHICGYVRSYLYLAFFIKNAPLIKHHIFPARRIPYTQYFVSKLSV